MRAAALVLTAALELPLPPCVLVTLLSPVLLVGLLLVGLLLVVVVLLLLNVV